MIIYGFLFINLFLGTWATPREEAAKAACGVDEEIIMEQLQEGKGLAHDVKCSIGCAVRILEKDVDGNPTSDEEVKQILVEHHLPEQSSGALLACVRSSDSEDDCVKGEAFTNCIDDKM